MSLFKEYLLRKKKNNEKIKVYLKATQQVKDKSSTGKKEDRINNVMLSGLIDDCDDDGLLLERQECYVPYHSILSIKPESMR